MNYYGIFVDYAQFAHKIINDLSWNISVILTKNTIKTDAGHASPTHWYLGNERQFIRMNIYYRRYPCRHMFFFSRKLMCLHYNDVIMSTMVSQITSLTIVYSTFYSRCRSKRHQSSASLTFMWGIHRWPLHYPHKGPVTWKMFVSIWWRHHELNTDYWSILT